MGSLGESTAPAAAAEEAQGDGDAQWVVFWCSNHWLPPSYRLEAMLPPWATLRRMDPARPLAEQVGDARVLIPTTGLVDAAAIGAPRDLRLIAQCAAGYCNIDIAAAKARGVPVTIAPGYNAAATAEIALTLCLMLSRRVDEARAAFQRRVIGEPIGHTLDGKTLGIVGLGNVGRRLAQAAEALGMRVLSTNSQSPRQQLHELLGQSDVVSLHCALNDATRGLIGAPELACMKPQALLINTARGPVVDKAALLDALRAGRLGGCGIDTGWDEPEDPADELFLHPKVLALPHTGSAAVEVYEAFANVLCENIVRCHDGRPLLHQLV